MAEKGGEPTFAEALVNGMVAPIPDVREILSVDHSGRVRSFGLPSMFDNPETAEMTADAAGAPLSSDCVPTPILLGLLGMVPSTSVHAEANWKV